MQLKLGVISDLHNHLVRTFTGASSGISKGYRRRPQDGLHAQNRPQIRNQRPDKPQEIKFHEIPITFTTIPEYWPLSPDPGPQGFDFHDFDTYSIAPKEKT